MIKKESKKKDEDLCTEIFHHSFDIITVTLSLPWQYIVVTCLAKNFIITVEPCFMDTHLIQTPGYYRQFALSLGKEHTFSLNSTCLIRTPINADNGHLFLAQWTYSYGKWTSLMWTLYYQLCVLTNLPFFKVKNPAVDSMSMFPVLQYTRQDDL